MRNSLCRENRRITRERLTRNDLNSDLVASGASDQLLVTLNPTLDPNAASTALVAIDNVAGPTHAKPGRGGDPCKIFG